MGCSVVIGELIAHRSRGGRERHARPGWNLILEEITGVEAQCRGGDLSGL